MIVAVACAVLAAVFMGIYAAGVRGEAAGARQGALERYGGETARVYVTTRAVGRGETLSERNVATEDWLVDLLPEGALVSGTDVLGQTAAAAIAENTPLAEVNIDRAGEPLDVPSGLVAVSVPCSNESAVGGALTAGSVIDVYVISDGSARLLCEGISVLKTNAEGTAASLSWATVAVNPAQVEALIAASGIQRLYFVLPSAEELARRAAEPAAPEPPQEAVPLPEGVVSGVAPFEGEDPGYVEDADGVDDNAEAYEPDPGIEEVLDGGPVPEGFGPNDGEA